MKTNFYQLTLLAVCFSGCLNPSPDTQVAIWDRLELAFEAGEPVGAPADVAFSIDLTAPDGRQIQQRGFWDGGASWKMRFMPDETGLWQYGSHTDPPISGLDGMDGAFEVVSAAEVQANRFLLHGAIRVSDNGRHFEHADGTPFLWLGDTAWNGALKSTEEAWDTYLADRVAKGFTGIQLVTTQWRAADGNAEGQVAYTGFEKIEINPAFFERMDRRIDAINDAGLLAAPVLLWTLGEPERNPGRLPEDQAVRLARYLTARYGAHHVMWILAGDENFADENGARWRRIGRAVFDDPRHASVTLHPRGRQWFFDDFSDEDWFDMIIYQSSHGGGPRTLEWLQTGPPAQKWNQPPIRPILNSEPGYEDHVAWELDRIHTADDVRRQFYWSLLNTPIAGLTYGAHGIWSWETEPAVPMNHDGSGIAKPWFEAMELPGSGQIKYVADLFTSIDWWTLRPAPELVLNQSEDPYGYIGASVAEDGNLAVFYLPEGGSLELEPGAVSADTGAVWFNPRDGSRQPAEAMVPGTYEAPDNNDWVLLVK